MKPLVLCILDGVGIREEKFGNALKEANTPNFDNLWNNTEFCKPLTKVTELNKKKRK